MRLGDCVVLVVLLPCVMRLTSASGAECVRGVCVSCAERPNRAWRDYPVQGKTEQVGEQAPCQEKRKIRHVF